MSKKRNQITRKILAVAMAVAMCAGTGFMTPVSDFIGINTVVSAAETYGDFRYAINDDNTVTITEYTGSNSEITIPSTINGKSVTSIGNYAFEYCTGLTSVEMPDSVTSIGSGAFSGCTGLKSITIPDSVTSIGSSAFYGCTGLTSIEISNSVIGYSMFRGCTGLKSITIPDSVTSIGDYAFDGCTGLTSITIPDSVTSIGWNAFSGCTGLTKIDVEPGNNSYSSQSGVLFNKDKTKLVAYPAGKQGGYTIPDSVTSIGYAVFDDCTGLTSITIPDSVTSIGNYAFCGCTGLTSITIPDSVTSIGISAFSNCTGLTSIMIPDSVTSIGRSAFSNCKGLTSVAIPDSVESIGNWAFEDCTNLTIYGHQGSYAETYANRENMPFVATLFNRSAVSADKIKLGGTVTVNANASGGSGNYTYAVLYKKTTDSKWIVKQNYKANANVSIKPKTSGTYDICVKVKDGNGDIEKKYFTVKVLGELENKSALSAKEITFGDTITATAKGEGGTGDYTYAVLYKKKSDTKWTVKQNYKKNSTVSIKPAHSTAYDVCIKVKDGDGKIVKKYFTVNVKKPALVNNATVSSSSITLGKTVTVKATATGGTTPYTYAVYTKKSTASKWTENQAYSTNSSVNFKPTAKGTYDICVKVKDKSGTIEKKYLTVTVK